MKKLTYQAGVIIQTVGMALIVGAFLLDHFLFHISDMFMIPIAVAAAIFITVGMFTIRRYKGHN